MTSRQVMGPSASIGFEKVTAIFSGRPQDFLQWKEDIVMLLAIKDLSLTVADELEESPPPTNQATLKAFSIIAFSLPPAIKMKLVHQIPSKDPKEALNWLTTQFAPQSQNRALSLSRELMEIKMRKNEDPTGYFMRIEKRHMTI